MKCFFKAAIDDDLDACVLGRSASRAQEESCRDRARHLLRTNDFLKDDGRYALAWREASCEMLVKCHDICTANSENLKAKGFSSPSQAGAVPPQKENPTLTVAQFAFVVLKVSCLRRFFIHLF